MKNFNDDYSFAIGFEEEVITTDCVKEFTNFIINFIRNTYPTLKILEWLENENELVRFEIVGYESKTNTIDLKITKFTNHLYSLLSIQTNKIFKFNVAKCVDNIFCVVTKNEKLLSELIDKQI